MPEPTPTSVQNVRIPLAVKLILFLLYTLLVAAIVMVVTIAVERSIQPSQQPVQTPSASTEPVTLYFYKGPFTQADSTPGTLTLTAVHRQAPADSDLYMFALDELAKGPTVTEIAQGLRSAFAFSGISNCGGADYKLTRVESTMKVMLCRDLDLSNQLPVSGGTYAGMSLDILYNAREEIKKSLKFGDITKVEVRDSNGQCLVPDVIDTDCVP